MAPEKVLYSTSALAVGGRDGRASSGDSQLVVKLATPRELGGAGGDGTNPEQLFAAGYAACFLNSMKYAALQTKSSISAETTVEATVGIGPNNAGGFALQLALRINVPGMPHDAVHSLVEKAHLICPYSNATRNNMPVTFIID